METAGKDLSSVTSNILSYYGGIVEPVTRGTADFVIPDSVGKILAIPEHGQLCFTYDEDHSDAIDATYDSQFFAAIKEVFSGHGKIATATHPAYQPGVEKITKNITKNLRFANATFRIGNPKAEDFTYLLVYFKYVALSDEKHEGLFSVLINEKNHSTMDIASIRPDILGTLTNASNTPSTVDQQMMKSLANSCSTAAYIAKQKLSDFINSLERRLNRDVGRVYEYYETMKQELRKTIEKKSRVDNDATIDEKAIKRLTDKLAAIEAEQQWKVQDLIAKYALKIQSAPISMIRITTGSIIFWINIKRRLATRKFPLTYNPLARQIDIVPCEFCFFPRGAYYVCDEHLHITCASCFQACSHCQKQFCKACHPDRCPKCKKKH